MKPCHPFPVFFLLMLLACCASAADDRGLQLLEVIVGAPGSGLSISETQLIKPTPTPWAHDSLRPVWHAKVLRDGKESGYLMWESEGTGKLIEFSLNRTEKVAGSHCIEGVPNLQQFGVPGQSAPQVCSGCVPTAASNLVAFWATRDLPQWGELRDSKAPSVTELQSIATRLRKLLKMDEIPDTLGYTDDLRPLSGAMPDDLAAALRTDAAAHTVKATIEIAPFSAGRLRKEIAAGRPVLVSCTVRLPQKPQLSWGHEVTGIGWTEIDGEFFVAVRDNYYPAQDSDTRWIRADAFDTMITVVPE